MITCYNHVLGSFFTYLYLIKIVFAVNVDTKYPILLYQNGSNMFSASASFRDYLGMKKFIISAPKWSSNYMDENYSASLYDCLIYNETFRCDAVKTDFSSRKHQDLLVGSSLASDNKITVACSHLRLNEIEIGSNYPNGGCLVFKTEQKIKFDYNLLPFQDSNLQISFNTYFYSHAMVGFSSLLNKKTKSLILGAPGFWGWRGSIVYYKKINTLNSEGQFNIPLATIRYPIELRNKPDSYFGFSLAEGRSFEDGEKLIAVGAPRFNGYGAVWYFTIDKLISSQSTDYIRDSKSILGEEIGGYFGSSLAFADLNNDKKDELIIGQPNYSVEKLGDCGRVLIYSSDRKNFNLVRILTGLKAGGRFGYSVSTINDIDQDGVKDLIIASPFEKTGGSIYIYNGIKGSLPVRHSQRISAIDVFPNPNVKGFGMTVLTNFDLDNNKYPDLLVASPISGTAAIIRTSPIAIIKRRLDFDKLSIDMNNRTCLGSKASVKVACFKVSFCLELEGKHVFGKHAIQIKIIIDTLFGANLIMNKRAYFKYNSTSSTEFNQLVELESGKMVCQEAIQVLLKDKINDKLTPMQFTLSYKFDESSSKFCGSCPILVKNDSLHEQIAFETGCGDDGQCFAEVYSKMSLKYKNSNISAVIEGFHEMITLVIEVINGGENAHSAKMILTVEPAIKLMWQTYEIIEQNETSMNILIDVGNPLEKERKEFKLLFDLTGLENYNNITFTCNFNTRSKLNSKSSTTKKLLIPIMHFSSITLQSKFKENTFFDHPDVRKKDMETFTVIFTILKSNYSSVRHSLIAVDFPIYTLNGQKIGYKPRIESLSRVSISCDTSLLDVEAIPDEEDVTKPYVEALKRPKRSKRVSNLTDTEINSTKRKELVINCKNFQCKRVQCILGTLNNKFSSTNVQVISAINLKEIERIYGNSFDVVRYVIPAEARILDSKNELDQNWSTSGEAEAILEQLPYKDAIPLWVIITCSLVALFMLYLITLALVKVGFFRRKQREELRQITNRMSRYVDPDATTKL